MKNFVLYITLFRILAGPIVFLLIFLEESYLGALFIFIAASLSDFLDGKLARSYKVESSLGEILDPIADKILVLFSLFTITLLTMDPFIGGISAVMLGREFWVSALREHAAKNLLSDSTKVTFLAKTKTAIQLLAISIFYFGMVIGNALIIFLAKFMLFLALLIAIKTSIDYSKKVFIL